MWSLITKLTFYHLSSRIGKLSPSILLFIVKLIHELVSIFLSHCLEWKLFSVMSEIKHNWMKWMLFFKSISPSCNHPFFLLSLVTITENTVFAVGTESWPVLWRVTAKCESDWEQCHGLAFPGELQLLFIHFKSELWLSSTGDYTIKADNRPRAQNRNLCRSA